MTAPTGYIVLFRDRADGKWSTLDEPLPQSLADLVALLEQPVAWADAVYVGGLVPAGNWTTAILTEAAGAAAEKCAAAGFSVSEWPDWLRLSRAAENTFHDRLDELEHAAEDRADLQATERARLRG